MKKYHVFKSEEDYSEILFIVPENKKDIVNSFKKNKSMEYVCKSVIQANFLNKIFINSGDYYTLFMGD